MKLSRQFVLCSIAAALTLGSSALWAQDKDNPPPPRPPGGDRGGDRGRGRSDPAEMQKQYMEGIRDYLGFKEEAEWAAVQPLVQKVVDLSREMLISRFSGIRFGRRQNGDGKSSSRRPPDSNSSPWFTPSPEVEALQKAIDDDAPAAQVKAALEKLRASKRDKEAKLAAAQEDLRKVLTARQEAQATLRGLLP